MTEVGSKPVTLACALFQATKKWVRHVVLSTCMDEEVMHRKAGTLRAGEDVMLQIDALIGSCFGSRSPCSNQNLIESTLMLAIMPVAL